jgi:hypothetical protein
LGAGAAAAGCGTRMFVEHARQRTVFPRQFVGTASTLRHVRFGHMIRIDSAGFDIAKFSRHRYIGPSTARLKDCDF